jgi:hypothetical protein
LKSYADIISFDWENAEVGVWHDGLTVIRAEAESRDHKITVESSEMISCGRLRFEALHSDCDYRVTVYFPDEERYLEFRTLPRPQGQMLASYAVISDPHISVKHDNRKGRLFVESAQILQEVLEHCSSLKVDFALFGGDLTNNAETEEFEKFTECLKAVDFPVVAAPGDHDVKPDRTNWRHLMRNSVSSSFTTDLFNLCAIDTTENCLSADDAARIEATLDDPRVPLIVTHVHILHNPELKYGSKVGGITNYGEYEELFERLFKRDSVIYAGHQNIPSRVETGRLVQVHLPQTCQYPCAWLYVRVFSNAIYHTTVPVGSEILRQYSRIDSERAAAAFCEPQWKSEYRQGATPASGNFVIPAIVPELPQ